MFSTFPRHSLLIPTATVAMIYFPHEFFFHSFPSSHHSHPIKGLHSFPCASLIIGLPDPGFHTHTHTPFHPPHMEVTTCAKARRTFPTHKPHTYFKGYLSPSDAKGLSVISPSSLLFSGYSEFLFHIISAINWALVTYDESHPSTSAFADWARFPCWVWDQSSLSHWAPAWCYLLHAATAVKLWDNQVLSLGLENWGLVVIIHSGTI
jgi:hypothetical protein